MADNISSDMAFRNMRQLVGQRRDTMDESILKINPNRLLIGTAALLEMNNDTKNWMAAIREDLMVLVNSCEYRNRTTYYYDTITKMLNINIQTCTQPGKYINEYLEKETNKIYLRVIGFYHKGYGLIGVNLCLVDRTF